MLVVCLLLVGLSSSAQSSDDYQSSGNSLRDASHVKQLAPRASQLTTSLLTRDSQLPTRNSHVTLIVWEEELAPRNSQLATHFAPRSIRVAAQDDPFEEPVVEEPVVEEPEIDPQIDSDPFEDDPLEDGPAETEETMAAPQRGQQPSEAISPLEMKSPKYGEPDRTDDLSEKFFTDIAEDNVDDVAANKELQAKQLAKERAENDKNCREEYEQLVSTGIHSIDLNIRVKGDPGIDFPFECGLGDNLYRPRAWPQLTYMWKASGLCHKPLYFEQVQLERYGHSWGPYIQPLVSGAHFFATVPILPYKMGLKTPNECVYSLGYYRPGSCAPYMIDPVPFTWRAALFEAGAVVGVAAAIP